MSSDDAEPGTTADAGSRADEARRPYHHGDLRAALLSRAEEVLAERGAAGFSLRAVAKRAGVSHAAPAHHFGDARGLLTALAADGYRRLDAAQDALEADAEGGARLAASGRAYVAFALENRALFALMFDAARLDWEDAALRRWGGGAFERLRRNAAGSTGEGGGGDGGEGEALAELRVAWSLVHGLATLMIAGHLGELAAMPARARDEAVGALLSRQLGRPRRG